MIVTFYSYKGGVGRTQMLANLAAYMCYKHQKKVLTIDWDLEAPGLHEYLKIDKNSSEKGLIDLFVSYETVVNTNDAEEIDTEALPKLDESYIIPTKIKGNAGGRVDLVTAGKYDKEYHAKVNDFNWHRFYHLLDGKVYIEYLKKHLKTLDYDLIFIDSRTGVTDYSGICNIQFPEINIIALAPNQQNLKGALTMAKKIKSSPYLKLKIGGEPLRYPIILPILSRLDKTDDKEATGWQRLIKDKFSSYISRSLSLLKSTQNITDYIKDTLLYYTIDLAYREQILFKKKGFEEKNRLIGIAAQFQNIAELILLNLPKNNRVSTNIDRKTKENPKALAGLGSYHYYSGNYQEALNSLKRATTLNPDLEDAWFDLGRTYYKLEKYDKTIQSFKKAIQLKLDFHLAWNHLGIVYRQLKQYDKAIEAYYKTIKLKPNYHKAWNNLGVVYKDLKHPGKTIEALQKSIKLKPDYHHTWNSLGVAYGELKQYNKAIEAYNKALQLQPDYYYAWNNLGVAYKNLEQYDKAIEAYNKALQLKSNSHDTWFNLANMYLSKTNLSKAKNAFLHVLSLQKQHSFAMMNLGHIRLIKNYHKKAIQKYQQSITNYPSYEDFFADFEEDFEGFNLPQYGIKKADYFALLEELKAWAKQEGHL